MMQGEERRTGEVGFRVYRDYFKHLCDTPMFFVLVLYLILSTGLSYVVKWWLRYWSAEEPRAFDDASFQARSTDFFLSIYVAIRLAFTLKTYTRSVWLLALALRAARKLQDRIVD